MNSITRRDLLTTIFEKHRNNELTTFEAISKVYLIFPEYSNKLENKYICTYCGYVFYEDEKLNQSITSEILIKLFYSMTTVAWKEATENAFELCPHCKQLSAKLIQPQSYENY